MFLLATLCNVNGVCSVVVPTRIDRGFTTHYRAADGGQPAVVREKMLMISLYVVVLSFGGKSIELRDVVKFSCFYQCRHFLPLSAA